MSKEFAKAFYNSKAWKTCRDTYAKKRCYLCERCGAPANIVHHKNRVSPETINDPKVLLNFENLELLCHACHQKEHEQERKQGQKKYNGTFHAEERYFIDENGKVHAK